MKKVPEGAFRKNAIVTTMIRTRRHQRDQKISSAAENVDWADKDRRQQAASDKPPAKTSSGKKRA
jgi:hypothetical protein